LTEGEAKKIIAKNRRKPEKTGEKGKGLPKIKNRLQNPLKVSKTLQNWKVGNIEHRTSNAEHRSGSGTGTVPELAVPPRQDRAAFKGHDSFFIERDFIKPDLGRKTYGKYLVGSGCAVMESD
jgi:hypothetical protein